MRVLVIEEDTPLGHALQEFLVEQGYAVDWLADGDQVLGAVAGQSYDLLLLDLNLPGHSGLDILAKLRAEGEQVPVLILTARDGVEDRVARSEEHTSELQSLMRISYAVFCLKKKKNRT